MDLHTKNIRVSPSRASREEQLLSVPEFTPFFELRKYPKTGISSDVSLELDFGNPFKIILGLIQPILKYFRSPELPLLGFTLIFTNFPVRISDDSWIWANRDEFGQFGFTFDWNPCTRPGIVIIVQIMRRRVVKTGAGNMLPDIYGNLARTGLCIFPCLCETRNFHTRFMISGWTRSKDTDAKPWNFSRCIGILLLRKNYFLSLFPICKRTMPSCLISYTYQAQAQVMRHKL